MENPVNLIGEILGQINNRRTQDVIRLRFGLDDGEPKTLQEIGEKYNITRERVRQIENNGLSSLANAAVKERIMPLQETIYDYLKEYGDLRRESSLYNDMVCICYPANQTEQLYQKNGKELDRCRSSLALILTLADPFNRIGETDDFYPVWTISQSALKTAAKTVDSAVKQFSHKNQVLKDKEVLELLKKKFPGISDKAILSYIDASKPIEQNAFGDFGLADWPEISPRGVRDKAYLVFKREGRPLHFSEVTDLINQLLSANKTAYTQTVHNELIKDPRFILIGRGIYALKEWGYEPGTVVEIISQLLKEKGPLTKEEIIKNVLAKRLIKDNTILINLQNKKYFKKLADGRFATV